MADFSVNPDTFFSSKGVPKTITVKPLAKNDGEAPKKRQLRIKVPGYDDKIIKLTQEGKPSATT